VTRLLLPLPDAPVNRFRHSFESTPVETLTLAQALETIRTGHYQSEVRVVRAILAHRGKAAYDKAKARLSAFTFGGVFAPSRGNAHLQRHSGLLHIDMDHLSDMAAIKHALSADPHIVYVFISPGSLGLKAGIHVPVVDDDAGYKHAWHAARAEYERRYEVPWDPSGKDISRLCFVSHDPDLHWNPDAACFDVPPPVAEPQPAPLPPTPQEPYRAPGRHSYEPRRAVDRALRHAVQMIQLAPLGTRHHTRLKAARLLGGYVGAGLLSYEVALATLSHALEGHTEDLPGALKTVVDGLTYGEAAPFQLEELEADWHRWMAAHRPTPTPPPSPPAHDPWEGTHIFRIKPFSHHRGIRLRGRQGRHG
jgi:VirE N-terminal domain